MGFVDIHSHLLPGLDDGAQDLRTALDMARIALKQGVSHCICTPHIEPGRFDNTKKSIESSLTLFKKALKEHNIDLVVAAAAEVHFGLEVISGIHKGEVPFLGKWQDMNVMLLELPHGHVPYGAEDLTKWLIANNVIPLIAHPERNRGFIKQPSRLDVFLQQGCLTQVTTASFFGRFGESAQILAEELARENKITVIASDAHSIEKRPPLFLDALERIEKIAGKEAAEQWMVKNPWTIAESLFTYSR